MKSIAIFNNKGGVGKTTLSFHLAYALSEIGKNVLVIDLDPSAISPSLPSMKNKLKKFGAKKTILLTNIKSR